MSKLTHKTQQLNRKALETLTALLSNKTKCQAAISLSIDRSTLYQRIEKYGLDKIIAEIPSKALLSLQLASEAAVDELISELSDEDAKMRREAAVEILNRVGLGAPRPLIAVQNNQILNDPMSLEFVPISEARIRQFNPNYSPGKNSGKEPVEVCGEPLLERPFYIHAEENINSLPPDTIPENKFSTFRIGRD